MKLTKPQQKLLQSVYDATSGEGWILWIRNGPNNNKATIRALARKGLLVLDGNLFRITKAGIRFIRGEQETHDPLVRIIKDSLLREWSYTHVGETDDGLLDRIANCIAKAVKTKIQKVKIMGKKIFEQRGTKSSLWAVWADREEGFRGPHLAVWSAARKCWVSQGPVPDTVRRAGLSRKKDQVVFAAETILEVMNFVLGFRTALAIIERFVRRRRKDET